MSKKEKLFEQFPPVSREEWMEKIRTDLKGADFNKKLVWKFSESLEIMPFYMKEDIENLKYIGSRPGQFPYIRGNKTDNNIWRVRQNITVTDYYDANKKALEILLKGVDSLEFIISDPESVTGENIDALLKNIVPEAVELNFLSNGKAKEIVGFLTDNLKDKRAWITLLMLSGSQKGCPDFVQFT
jgi:methylmalonyl-CoA mutase